MKNFLLNAPKQKYIPTVKSSSFSLNGNESNDSEIINEEKNLNFETEKIRK